MVKRIILCSTCKGLGKREVFEITNYHNGITIDWDSPCEFCDGTGRLVEEITTRKLTEEELGLREKPEAE